MTDRPLCNNSAGCSSQSSGQEAGEKLQGGVEETRTCKVFGLEYSVFTDNQGVEFWSSDGVLQGLFSISIEGASTFGADITMYMEPGHRVMGVAKALSLAYPGKHIRVGMHATFRRIYLDGDIVGSWPDITERFSNMTEKDQYAWSCCGTETD